MPTKLMPPRFPVLSSAQARMNNLLVSRRPTFAVELAGQAVTFRLTPDALAPPTLQVQLSAPGIAYCLELSEGFLASLTEPFGVDESLDKLPSALQDALLAAALTPLAQKLAFAPTTQITRVRDTNTSEARDVCLGLWQETPSAALPAANLRLGANASAALLSALEGAPPSGTLDAWATLKLCIGTALGSVPLTAGEIRHLAIDDALLLPADSAAEPAIVLKLGARPVAMAHVEQARIIIDQILEQDMAEDEQAAPRTEAAPPALEPESLEIRLDFDLGHVMLTLGELRNLQPGYSFALDMPAGGRVRILAGSQIIGQGELVRIDERLGVRITKLAQQTDG